MLQAGTLTSLDPTEAEGEQVMVESKNEESNSYLDQLIIILDHMSEKQRKKVLEEYKDSTPTPLFDSDPDEQF
tara:strand:+ start:354 stop:572 length:219 start_codon:yes stop_codon:yes gene_type:complete